METEKVEILTQIRTINHTNRWTQHNQEMKNMMKIESFAASMRTQFADSYKRDGPAEIIPGTGIMNYHLTDSKKEWLPLTNVKNNTKQTDQPHQEMNNTKLRDENYVKKWKWKQQSGATQSE